MDLIDLMTRRRSVGRLEEPAPTDAELARILDAAVAAPDHGELRPWRFVVLRGGAKEAFGAVLAEGYERRCADAGKEVVAAKLDKERVKLGRAPLVVVVAAVPASETKVPEIDQVLAAGAATQNLILAATALGYGAMWRTGEACDDEHVKAALALRPSDTIVGFVYLGTVPEGAKVSSTPRSADGAVTVWEPA